MTGCENGGVPTPTTATSAPVVTTAETTIDEPDPIEQETTIANIKLGDIELEIVQTRDGGNTESEYVGDFKIANSNGGVELDVRNISDSGAVLPRDEAKIQEMFLLVETTCYGEEKKLVVFKTGDDDKPHFAMFYALNNDGEVNSDVQVMPLGFDDNGKAFEINANGSIITIGDNRIFFDSYRNKLIEIDEDRIVARLGEGKTAFELYEYAPQADKETEYHGDFLLVNDKSAVYLSTPMVSNTGIPIKRNNTESHFEFLTATAEGLEYPVIVFKAGFSASEFYLFATFYTVDENGELRRFYDETPELVDDVTNPTIQYSVELDGDVIDIGEKRFQLDFEEYKIDEISEPKQ